MAELCALETDLVPDGAFGAEQLVLTDDKLTMRVGERVRLDVELSALRAPRIEQLIGGSAIQATVHGEPIEIVRYSDALASKFAPVAKFLSDFVASRCRWTAAGARATHRHFEALPAL